MVLFERVAGGVVVFEVVVGVVVMLALSGSGAMGDWLVGSAVASLGASGDACLSTLLPAL